MAAIVGVLGLTAATAAGQWRLIDNFNDGNDEGWTHHDLLLRTPWGPTIYDASSFEYVISSTTSIPSQNEYVFTGSIWAESERDPFYSEGVLRTTIRADNQSTHSASVMRWDYEEVSGYVFATNHLANEIAIVRFDRGTFSVPAAGSFPLAVGRDYIMEAGASGSTLSLRIWAPGDPRPQNPQLLAVDGTYSRGAFGTYLYNPSQAAGGRAGPLSGSFDDVYFVPEPAVLQALLPGAVLLLRRRGGRLR